MKTHDISDWTSVPDWVKYKAMDADGHWYGFKVHPIRQGYCYVSNGPSVHLGRDTRWTYSICSRNL